MCSPMLEAANPRQYLGGDAIIEAEDPAIQTLGQQLRHQSGDDISVAKAAFEWVRDQVAHSYDANNPLVTLTAVDRLPV